MYKEYFFSILCLLWNDFATVQTVGLKFPQNLTVGASTSSYQIEGAWNADGKGESIWDRFTHTKPERIRDRKNGDDAAKSYYLYKKDSDLLKKIGFDHYRFSISWPRILPNGDLSVINEAGIRHYQDVLDDLLEKKIEPVVTMYHWDLPQKLQDVGGWMNSSIAIHMENYANILFSALGDRVKWWLTINEPFYIVKGYSLNKTYAPSLGLGTPADYIVAHNILLAHMRIYRLYEKVYKSKQNGKISIALNHEFCVPQTGSQEDMEAVERHYQFGLGLFAHPIYSTEGDYPKLVRKIVNSNSKKDGLKQSRLPVFTQKEINSLRGTYDYFGFNYYANMFCGSVSKKKPMNERLPFYRDMNVYAVAPNSPEMEVDVKGFRLILSKISKDYKFPEIFITENGYETFGVSNNDLARIDYHRSHLNQLLEAYYYDKCNITGYTIWSLLDNFEWTLGYTSTFGIYSVDYNSINRKRTRKLSSYFIEKILKTRIME